jgi:NAD(P)-dependent dehydrogenase (short-subunit alcohol dehydrogenase family)
MELTGRTVLLTGAAGGIGHHIADVLARRGARLVVSDATDEQLAAAPLPPDATRIAADLRSLDAIADLVARAGAIDVLVNCAGLEYTGAFHDQGRDELADILQVNLHAPMELIRLVVPGMLARGAGHVVNIASISGKGPSPFLAAYGTTKAGLIELTRSLRVEYRDSCVGFSAVSPGFVAREGMYARMAEPGLEAPVTLGTSPPEQVAQAVLEVIEKDVPERIVTARPMRPFFALTELSPQIGELGIIGSGARRFLKRVAERRGRA